MEKDKDLAIVEAAATRLADRNVCLRAFLLRLIDPEDLGHAVSPEVRNGAMHALNIANPTPRQEPNNGI